MLISKTRQYGSRWISLSTLHWVRRPRTLKTVHFTLHTVHRTLYTVHCIPYTVHSEHFPIFTVQTKNCKLHFLSKVYFAVFSLDCKNKKMNIYAHIRNVHSLTFHCTVHNTSKQGVLTILIRVVPGQSQCCGALQFTSLLPLALQECLVRRSSIMLHAW